MAEENSPDSPDEADEKKKSGKSLIVGLVLALAGGAGGFYAVNSGMILGAGEEEHVEMEEVYVSAFPDIAFVPVDPLVINLAAGSGRSHLRFEAQLEVPSMYEEEVATLMPRVLDVLNGYLRAVEVAELEEPSALLRLRAQMLRRVQTVAGEGRVRDLLIMEFVLN